VKALAELSNPVVTDARVAMVVGVAPHDLTKAKAAGRGMTETRVALGATILPNGSFAPTAIDARRPLEAPVIPAFV
jgi:hypothetical protein